MRRVPPPVANDEPPFALAIDRLDAHRAALSAWGELDLAAVKHLAVLLLTSEVTDRTVVHFDLSRVTFMDCSCLGVLVGAHRRLRSVRGRLILAPTSDPVSRLIELTRLDRTLLAAEALHGPIGIVPDPPGRRWSVPDHGAGMDTPVRPR